MGGGGSKNPFDDFTNFFKMIGEGITNTFNKVKDSFNEIVKGFDKVTGFFRQLGENFKKLNDVGEDLKRIFRTIDKAIEDDIKSISTATDTSFYKFSDTILTSFEFVISHITCGIKLIANFQQCYMYYAWNMMLNLLWSPFAFVIWLIRSFTGYDLNGWVNYLWDLVVEFDCYMYPTTNFSITKWSPEIELMCFNCCRVTSQAVKRRGEDFGHYFNKEGPEFINNTFKDGYWKISADGDRLKNDFVWKFDV